MTISVLIVDDHPVFLSGVRTTFADVPDIEVIGDASSGADAIAAVAALTPDVALMDVNMPDINGIEATRRIVDSGSKCAVLVLTMFDDDESVFAAMSAGARGYLVKGASQESIVDAVRAVAAGEVVFGAAVARHVLAFFSAQRKGGRTSGPFPSLTDREVEVLELVAAGETNQRIARTLFLSEKTIRNNVSAIFSKLQVANRAEAIVRARQAGLGGESPR